MRAAALLLAALLLSPEAARACARSAGEAVLALELAAAGDAPEADAEDLLLCGLGGPCDPGHAAAGLYAGFATIQALSCYPPGVGFATDLSAVLAYAGDRIALSIRVPGLPPFLADAPRDAYDPDSGAFALGPARLAYPAPLCTFDFDLSLAATLDAGTGAFDGAVSGEGAPRSGDAFCLPFLLPVRKNCALSLEMHGACAP